MPQKIQFFARFLLPILLASVLLPCAAAARPLGAITAGQAQITTSRLQEQLKGIFICNPALLGAHPPSAHYERFIERNEQSVLSGDRGPKDLFGVVWSALPGPVNASTESSALDAAVAVFQAGSGRITE